MGADDSSDVTGLRRDIEEIKAAQKDIQRNLQSLKDILSGKQPPLDNVYLDTSGRPALGNDDAPVSIVEFTDFQCPFCGGYARETLGRIVADYVRTGKVRYIVRNFPLDQSHPLAEKAAESALCAHDQGKFWQAHDRFFADQRKLSVGDMPDHAAAMGLNAGVFMDCINSAKYADAVNADRSYGEALGVRGTPTFFIGMVDPENPGRAHALRALMGNLPLRDFQKAIEEVLAEANRNAESKP
jgi:protein-disulfide isomerase